MSLVEKKKRFTLENLSKTGILPYKFGQTICATCVAFSTIHKKGHIWHEYHALQLKIDLKNDLYNWLKWHNVIFYIWKEDYIISEVLKFANVRITLCKIKFLFCLYYKCGLYSACTLLLKKINKSPSVFDPQYIQLWRLHVMT